MLVKNLRKLVESKWPPRAADADDLRDIRDKLDPYIRVLFGKNAEELWIHPVGKEGIKTLLPPPYFPKIVELNKYNYLNPFLDTALNPGCHHANWFFQK